MRSVQAHRSLVRALIPQPKPISVPLCSASGLALATDVVSPAALPGFDSAAMDGYAIRSSDLARAAHEYPVSLPVFVDTPAGDTRLMTLAPRSAHRIMTGALMPTGADAVVPREHIVQRTGFPHSGRVSFLRPVEAGANVRKRGSDIAEGAAALRSGTILQGPQLALLAALGFVEVKVVPRIRVLVISTGNEIVPAGITLAEGQIYDTNTVMLAAEISSAGAEVVDTIAVGDNTGNFRNVLDNECGNVDLVLTTGGISAGAYEVVRDALSEHDVNFSAVSIRPGKPQGVGRYRGTPIVCFPGNPLSALVSFEVFLRPALRAAMRYPAATRPTVARRLAMDLQSPGGKREYRFGRCGAGLVTVDAAGSNQVAGAAMSDGLIEILEDQTLVPAGSLVRVWLRS